MRAGAIVKDVGIPTGEGSFIHSYERLGVIEEPLTRAWRRRIAFAFLFPRPAPDRRKKKSWSMATIVLGAVGTAISGGFEAQAADPFIAVKMGTDATPAYRGTAYVVFEELTLSRFGNPIPQFSF